MRATVLVVLAVALAIPAGRAGAAEPSKPATGTASSVSVNPFDVTDRNHDGGVDRAELMQRQTDVFYFQDANKDGVLVIEEIRDVEPVRFKAADTDGNGSLTLPEYLDARSRDFDAADTNKDGKLTSTEAAAK